MTRTTGARHKAQAKVKGSPTPLSPCIRLSLSPGPTACVCDLLRLCFQLFCFISLPFQGIDFVADIFVFVRQKSKREREGRECKSEIAVQHAA